MIELPPATSRCASGFETAGSTSASLLAKAGRSVRLFEKIKFPREHVGELPLPFGYPIFKELGVLEEVTRLFVRKPTVRFLTGDFFENNEKYNAFFNFLP